MKITFADFWRPSGTIDQWWSDAIIHRIHLRVLRHIRDEAERKSLELAPVR